MISFKSKYLYIILKLGTCINSDKLYHHLLLLNLQFKTDRCSILHSEILRVTGSSSACIISRFQKNDDQLVSITNLVSFPASLGVKSSSDAL